MMPHLKSASDKLRWSIILIRAAATENFSLLMKLGNTFQTLPSVLSTTP